MKKTPSFCIYLFAGWVPAAAWCAVIYYISSRPASVLPSGFFPHMDKFAHAVEFGVLATLSCRAAYWPLSRSEIGRDSLKIPAAVLLFCMIFAALDEFHQIYVPGRSADWKDWVADVSGAFLAVLLIRFLSRNTRT